MFKVVVARLHFFIAVDFFIEFYFDLQIVNEQLTEHLIPLVLSQLVKGARLVLVPFSFRPLTPFAVPERTQAFVLVEPPHRFCLGRRRFDNNIGASRQ